MIRFVRTTRRGFTLVELLIAVVVFAIGLLGLGALFPAVIAKQRNAIDSTMGAGAIDGVVAQLQSGGLIPWDELTNTDDTQGPVYIPSGYDEPKATRWVENNDFSPVPFLSTGDSSILYTVQSGSGTNIQVNLPVSSRLNPQPFDETDPRYVWDLLIRREPGTDRLQAAVFLRRIDTGISVPKGMTLSHVLTGIKPPGSTSTLPQRLPIEVVDAELPNLNFRPVSSGVQGHYSVPIEVRVEKPLGVVAGFGSSVQDGAQVILRKQAKALTRAIGRRGQKLVCGDGIVREVIDVIPQRKDDVLVVSPPFDFLNDDGTTRIYERVVFTPQVPAQVRVFTVGG